MEEVLSEGQILKALERLAVLLKEKRIQGEICFLGGAAMVLAFKARPSTKDVDAIFQPAQVIRELAFMVQKEHSLPENWLNDAAKSLSQNSIRRTEAERKAARQGGPTMPYKRSNKARRPDAEWRSCSRPNPGGGFGIGSNGYLSTRHEVAAGDLPQFENLRLTAPTAEYLLAMKCMASRIPGHPDERGDVQDIRFLIKRLSLKTPEEAMAIVAGYFPENRIPARARFLIEDIFTELGGSR